MPHLSQKSVEARWLGKINELFLAIVSDSKTSHVRKRIIAELLTDTEQLMLAKRIALIAMINAEFSSYTISKRLKVSTATVKRFRKLLDGSAFRYIQTQLARVCELAVFWETLEQVSRGGLRPRVGRSRRLSLLQKRSRT